MSGTDGRTNVSYDNPGLDTKANVSDNSPGDIKATVDFICKMYSSYYDFFSRPIYLLGTSCVCVFN